MDKIFLLALMILSGVGLSAQAAINGSLGRSIGAVEGALVSFFIGTIALIFAVLFLGKGDLLSVFTVPKWQLFGGLIGAVYVFALTLAAPRIGVGMSVIAVICGQMVMSMIVDHYGLFQSKQIAVNGYRITGVLFLVGALIFIYLGSNQSAATPDK